MKAPLRQSGRKEKHEKPFYSTAGSKYLLEGISEKTWLVDKLCNEWGGGNFLHLPQSDNEVQCLDFLTDLLEYGKKKATGRAFSTDNIDGDDIIIFFNGFDKLQEGSLFWDIIQGKYLPQATILITSSGEQASELIKERTDNLFILNFSMTSSTSNIKQFPLQISARICMPAVFSIIQFLVKEGVSLKMPSNLTELYHTFVSEAMKSIPTDPSANKIGEYAWNGICHNKFQFTKVHELMAVPGLVTEADEKCCFRHKSIQEFLAASYIYSFPDQIEEVFQRYSQQSQFSGTLFFLAGLMYGMLPESITIIPGKISRFDILHQLYESGSYVANSSEIEVSATFPAPPYPHDFLALGYCIGKSHVSWKLGFTLRSLSKLHMEMLVLGMGDNPGGQIKELNLSLNDLCTESISILLDLAKNSNVLNKLKLLSLHGNSLEGSNFVHEVMAPLLQALPELEQFLFHYNDFKPNQQKEVITETSKLSLSHITFSGLSQSECELVMSLKHKYSDTKIELHELESDSVESILQVLSETKHIRSLIIHESHLTNLQLKKISEKIQASSVTSFELFNCIVTISDGDNFIANEDTSAIVTPLLSSRKLYKHLEHLRLQCLPNERAIWSLNFTAEELQCL